MDDQNIGSQLSDSDLRDAFFLSAQRARIGIQTHPLATLAVCVAPGFSDRHPVFSQSIFALSLIAALLRWLGGRRLLRASVIRGRDWLLLIAIPVVFANLLWALLASAMLWQGQLDTEVMLVLLGSVALAFGCIVSYAPHRALAIGLVAMHLGLPLLSTLPHREQVWMLLALLMIACMLYVLRIANLLHRDYWAAVATRNHLNEARQRAEAANRAKDQFLANISHEIRTPLNGIAAPAELLQQAALNDEQRQLLNLIRSSTRTLGLLIDDLLDFAKIEAGKLTLLPQAFAVSRLLRAIVERHRLAAQAKGLSLRLLPEPLPDNDWLLGDPLRIGQIVDNLLSNALKFTDRGSIDVEVKLEKAHRNAHLTIVVSDTGSGIAEAMREKIFHPFVQGDGSSTRRFAGTGLGLSISKWLAEQMRGSLSFISSENIGTRFTLTLVLPQAEQPMQLERAQPEQLFAGLRVLVVEDNQINQLVIRHQLQALGIVEIDIAGDGEQALRVLAQRRYDLVLLDCQMPVLDGYQTVARLRKLEGVNVTVPVIALTAHAMASDAQRALAAGMNDYLSKPVSLQTLAHTLAQWVDRGEGARN